MRQVEQNGLSFGILALRALVCLLAILFITPFPAQRQQEDTWINNRSRNPSQDGPVSKGATVQETVFLAPTAKILGSASVQGATRIFGNAVVSGEALVDSGSSGDANY